MEKNLKKKVTLFCNLMDCSALSREFFRQEYWNGLPFPPPGDLPNTGIKPRSPVLQADFLPPEPQGNPSHINI